MEAGKMQPRMMEKADAVRGLSTFPPEWGFPPGRPDSEERARWVKERVTEHMALTRIKHRAATEAVKVENFERQRYLLLTRDR